MLIAHVHKTGAYAVVHAAVLWRVVYDMNGSAWCLGMVVHGACEW